MAYRGNAYGNILQNASFCYTTSASPPRKTNAFSKWYDNLKSTVALFTLMAVPSMMVCYLPTAADVAWKYTLAKNEGRRIEKLLLMANETNQGSLYLALRENEFRVLVLHPGSGNEMINCSLLTCQYSDDLPYHALSYAWGDPTPVETIRCNGCDVGVAANLHAALSSLRHPRRTRLLWVDAICIDQSNVAERGHQVKNMNNIFAAARTVLVWLGEETRDVLAAFSSIKVMGDRKFGQVLDSLDVSLFKWLEVEQPVRPEQQWGWDVIGYRFIRPEPDRRPVTKSLLVAVVPILELPWLTRLWVVQEVVYAKKATVIVGREELEWDIFANIIRDVLQADSVLGVLSEAARAGADSVVQMEIARQHRLRGQQQKLLSILLATNMAACSDSRDKIYAVLGLAGDYNPGVDSNSFEPDYGIDLSEVFKRFAQWSISNGNLNILSCTTRRQRGGDDATLVLPSWVPDWTRIDNYRPLGRFSSLLSFDAGWAQLSESDKSYRPTITSNDRLLLSGHTIATVESLGRSAFSTTYRRGTSDSIRSIRQWIQERERLVDPDTDRNAIWATVTAAMTADGGIAPDTFREWYREYREWLEITAESLADAYLYRYHRQVNQPNRRMEEIEASILTWTSQRKFAVLKGGRTALVPSSTQVGDKIAVFVGCPFPCALRQTRIGDEYKILGEAIVHGFMYRSCLPTVSFIRDFGVLFKSCRWSERIKAELKQQIVFQKFVIS